MVSQEKIIGIINGIRQINLQSLVFFTRIYFYEGFIQDKIHDDSDSEESECTDSSSEYSSDD